MFFEQKVFTDALSKARARARAPGERFPGFHADVDVSTAPPSSAQHGYLEAVQRALTNLQGHAQRASAAATPAAQPAASASEQSATSRPSGPHALSVGAASKLPHATQPRAVAPPAVLPAARSDEYWQRLYAMRDKYTPLLNATKVTVGRMSSAAGAAGDNRVIRTLDEELLPLLRSTPTSPAPAFRTLADLLAAERTMVTLINRVQAVVLAARQQQQARQQQAAAAPTGQQAVAAVGAPAPVKRRADAALPELSAAAKRRQARAEQPCTVAPPADAPSLLRASWSLPPPAPRPAPPSWRLWRRCPARGWWTTTRSWAPCLPPALHPAPWLCARLVACQRCLRCYLRITRIRRRWLCLTAARRAS